MASHINVTEPTSIGYELTGTIRWQDIFDDRPEEILSRRGEGRGGCHDAARKH
jgi:hypothetical protein